MHGHIVFLGLFDRDCGEVLGFALAGLDLSFVQRWLDEFDDPTVTIAIMDEQRVLLARKPGNADIGRPIEDEQLETFILSGEARNTPPTCRGRTSGSPSSLPSDSDLRLSKRTLSMG